MTTSTTQYDTDLDPLRAVLTRLQEGAKAVGPLVERLRGDLSEAAVLIPKTAQQLAARLEHQRAEAEQEARTLELTLAESRRRVAQEAEKRPAAERAIAKVAAELHALQGEYDALRVKMDALRAQATAFLTP